MSMAGTSGTVGNTVTAVFHDRDDAQRAISWLRDSGVSENAISVAARHGKDYTATGELGGKSEAADDASDAGKGALAGAGIGAGVGVLFGLAAAAIPGAGPFIAAGTLAQVLGAAGGAAVAGAVVGGTSGALAGALAHYGLNEAESNYYAGEVERGGTFVGVDLSQTTLDRTTVTDAFRRFNGHFHS